MVILFDSNSPFLSYLAPPRFIDVSSDKSLREGHHLQLICDASGRPTPNITWVKGGSESDVLHRGSTWDFKNISRTEAGIYRCTAYNGAGNAVSHTLRVNVQCEYMYMACFHLYIIIYTFLKVLPCIFFVVIHIRKKFN